MSLILKADKPLDSEVRRVASRYLVRARTVLEERPDGPHEAIHTARKQFKRVRSLYRLIATADRVFQKRENERIGALGRHLRESRDATSLVETAHRLADAASTAEERMAVNRVHQRLVARRDSVASAAATDDLIKEAIAICADALDAVDHFRFDAGPKRCAGILGEGWRRTGKKAALALRQAADTGAADSFHSLRKRTQDRWVHCHFLAQAWPAALSSARRHAKHLAALLGENQDIALLSDFADAHPHEIGPPEDLTHLIAVMTAEEGRLRAEALPLAAMLFPKNARKDAEHIALLWRHAA
ncbi:CHAD domain-containing protein [Mycoplana ramosa]|uniref:CHAD domain-containing protein n=1 Tax=Mycoplana ramosa TaxID=40837 RepID=A0ABW3YVZ4_MYCRA